MEQREIISFLNYPDKGLVDFAVSCANLNALELESIQHRIFLGETIEEAAEALYTSTDTIKRRSASGFRKLDACWSGKSWINTLIKQ